MVAAGAPGRSSQWVGDGEGRQAGYLQEDSDAAVERKGLAVRVVGEDGAERGPEHAMQAEPVKALVLGDVYAECGEEGGDGFGDASDGGGAMAGEGGEEPRGDGAAVAGSVSVA